MVIRLQNVGQLICKRWSINIRKAYQTSLAQMHKFSQKSGRCFQEIGKLRVEAQ